MKPEGDTWKLRSLLLLAFLIPLLPVAVPPAIILILITGLYKVDRVKILNNIREHSWPVVVSALFFIVNLLSLIWTEDPGSGWRNMETKLSFLLLPASILWLHRPDMIQMDKILRAFVLGTLAAGFLCVSYATFSMIAPEILIRNGLSDYDYSWYFFTKSRLSPFIHPTYLSLYFNFGILLLILKGKALKFTPPWQIFILVFLSLLIILLGSKAGILILALLIVLIALSKGIREKRYVLTGILLLAPSALFLWLWNVSPEFKGRFTSLVDALKGEVSQDASMESSALRITTWKAGLLAWKESPWYGYGAGSEDEAIQEFLSPEERSRHEGIKLNAHNQYLQSALTGGLLVLIPFLLFFVSPLVRHRKDPPFLIFALFILINMLFESMLQLQVGVVFCVFFYSLFMLKR